MSSNNGQLIIPNNIKEGDQNDEKPFTPEMNYAGDGKPQFNVMNPNFFAKVGMAGSPTN